MSELNATAAPASPREANLRAVLASPALRYACGVLVLAAAYVGAAKLGQTLRYTASVSAIWPPAGLGIAALYVYGLRWWPGILLGELIVNGELLLTHTEIPGGSLVGQQAGNMAEIVFGAWLLRRLIGPNAALDRASQVGGMIVAVGAATAISATFGTVSMLAGGVIDSSEVLNFWRTWLLGDASGALVVLPLVLTWLHNPRAAWRTIRTVEGALMICTIIALAIVAVTADAPLTYLIFPALIWAAFRFGPAGVTLSAAIIAGITIGVTADELGVFFKQPIDDRTLSTQLYILVTALTGLFLSAVVSERERSAQQLADSRRREGERALEERRRIARELHDSVSQALFSTVLHTRVAQKALDEDGGDLSRRLGQTLGTVGELTKRAQSEMRRFIFEWGPEGIGDGLVAALSQHGSTFDESMDLRVDVVGPAAPLPLTRLTETQLYGIGREALANVVRHSGASTAHIRVETDRDTVILIVEDDGCGFEPTATQPGQHFGLDSMRTRADEIGAALSITTAVGRGTTVRVDVRADASGNGR